MAQTVSPRQRTINKGLFRRQIIAGIEADAFVILMIVVGMTILPTRLQLFYLAIGAFEVGVFYPLFLILYRREPRAFTKIRNFIRWRHEYRAKHSLISVKKRK